MELIDFLRARLDEDEQCATAAGHGFGHLPLLAEHNAGWTRLDLTENVRPTYDQRYLKRFDPERVRAEVDAKRRIIDLCSGGAQFPDFEGGYEVAWEDCLCLLALPYADHPDYDPGWRP